MTRNSLILIRPFLYVSRAFQIHGAVTSNDVKSTPNRSKLTNDYDVTKSSIDFKWVSATFLYCFRFFTFDLVLWKSFFVLFPIKPGLKKMTIQKVLRLNTTNVFLVQLLQPDLFFHQKICMSQISLIMISHLLQHPQEMSMKTMKTVTGEVQTS